MRKCLAATGARPLLFYNNADQPLLYNEFLTRLRCILTSFGLDAHQYTAHSFRRGAASLALESGLATEYVKQLGDWTSQAYERYIAKDPYLLTSNVKLVQAIH
jgi:site-specific recombinase XerD